MEYLSKQKFNISDLARVPQTVPNVLLVINEGPLREIYLKHMLGHKFIANAAVFYDPQSISKHLDTADLLVVEVKTAQAEDMLGFLKRLAQNCPTLPVITIGLGLTGEILQSIMALGVVSHLDRQFSRPEDLVQIMNTVFNANVLTNN